MPLSKHREAIDALESLVEAVQRGYLLSPSIEQAEAVLFDWHDKREHPISQKRIVCSTCGTRMFYENISLPDDEGKRRCDFCEHALKLKAIEMLKEEGGVGNGRKKKKKGEEKVEADGRTVKGKKAFVEELRKLNDEDITGFLDSVPALEAQRFREYLKKY